MGLDAILSIVKTVAAVASPIIAYWGLRQKRKREESERERQVDRGLWETFLRGLKYQAAANAEAYKPTGGGFNFRTDADKAGYDRWHGLDTRLLEELRRWKVPGFEEAPAPIQAKLERTLAKALNTPQGEALRKALEGLEETPQKVFEETLTKALGEASQKLLPPAPDSAD